MFYRSILNELKEWSQSSSRRPLILRGARQVGKTTIVDAFGASFDQYIKLNLENSDDKTLFSVEANIHDLIQRIFFARQKQLAKRANTLLFIDEIQQVDGALNMLRYFYEEYPDLRVIAAGSLLETILHRKTNVPVGRIEYRVMRPVNFPEFLKAMGNDLATEQLEHVPLNGFAHSTLLNLFHSYALVGGMPEIVANYAEKKDLTALPGVYNRLINAYLDDVEKYGKTDTHVRVIRHCIRVCFTEAGKRIKFQHFGRSDYSSREVGDALRALEKVFLLSLLYPTISPVLPLLPDFRKSPRLQVLDTGLMNYFLGIQQDILGTADLNEVYQGTIIEHLVGQELLACQYGPLSSLNFWVREKKTSLAEVDYVYPFESQLIPIEVKAGKTGSLRSLHVFMDEAPHDMAIRFWSEPLNLSTVTTPSGKSFRLLSLPYYLASQTTKYIGWLKAQPPISSPR
jgi:predicted AAA+ superfamily ATPase